MNKKTEKLIEEHDPVSIFLYGSKARGDNLVDSDTEIGVLTNNKKQNDTKNVFFFNYKKFKRNEINTPFPVDIYLRELSLTAKTLYGKKIVENFTPPPITILSILERINFDCSTALYGFKLKKNELFYKSVLFGIRNLIIMKKKKFPLKYESIYESSRDLKLFEFQKLPEIAFKTRLGKKSPTQQNFKDSITLTNKFIRKKIRERIDKNEQILLK